MRNGHYTLNTRQNILKLKGTEDKQLAGFLDCYRELSRDAQLDIAAMLENMGLTPCCGALLFRLIQLGLI